LKSKYVFKPLTITDKILELLEKENVIGISKVIHEKEVDGYPTSEPAIRVYVTKKKPKKKLRKRDIVPETVNDMSTDVVEIGDVVAQSLLSRQRKVSPLMAGISIGSKSRDRGLCTTAGTLGFFGELDGEIVGITCTHVLTGKVWLNPSKVKSKIEIIQPGLYDGGGRIIGHIIDYEPIKLYRNTCFWRFYRRLFNQRLIINKLDAGIFSIEEDYILESIERRINCMDTAVGLLFAGSDKVSLHIPIDRIIDRFGLKLLMNYGFDIVKGDRICKSGRTTGYTCGWVIDPSAIIKVKYRGGYGLMDCRVSSWLSSEGDSGSLIIRGDRNEDRR